MRNCIDPVRLNCFPSIPDPNIPSAIRGEGQLVSWTGSPNYQFQYSVPNDTRTWDIRVDHSLSNNRRFWAL